MVKTTSEILRQLKSGSKSESPKVVPSKSNPSNSVSSLSHNSKFGAHAVRDDGAPKKQSNIVAGAPAAKQSELKDHDVGNATTLIPSVHEVDQIREPSVVSECEALGGGHDFTFDLGDDTDIDMGEHFASTKNDNLIGENLLHQPGGSGASKDEIVHSHKAGAPSESRSDLEIRTAELKKLIQSMEAMRSEYDVKLVEALNKYPECLELRQMDFTESSHCGANLCAPVITFCVVSSVGTWSPTLFSEDWVSFGCTSFMKRKSLLPSEPKQAGTQGKICVTQQKQLVLTVHQKKSSAPVQKTLFDGAPECK